MGTNFLIVVDAYSKWIEVYEQASLTSSQTIGNLLRCFATYGLPHQLHTDNGRAFTSEHFENFMKRNGIKQTTSPAYSPKSNGLAERAVQLFKQKMRKSDGTRHEKLMDFLLHYRTTIHQTANCSPAKRMFGRELRTKIDLVQPQPGRKPDVESNRPWEEERCFYPGEYVLARDFVSGKGQRWRTGVITARTGRFKYEVRVDGGSKITRHTDALKSFRRPEGVAIAETDDPIEIAPLMTEPDDSGGVVSERSSTATRAVEQLEGATRIERSTTNDTMAEPPRRNPRRHCGMPARYGMERTKEGEML